MPAFQFPDPAVEQSVINTLTGTTYVWRPDPGKWVAAKATNDTPSIQDQLTYVIQTDKILRSSQPAIELVDSENNYTNVKFEGVGGIQVNSTSSSIVYDSTNISNSIDLLDTLIDQEIDNRTALLNAAAGKNNQQDAAISALDARVDTISATVGVLEFKSEYTYELHKSADACAQALAACMSAPGADTSECNRAYVNCQNDIGQPLAPGKMTSWGSGETLEHAATEHFLFHNTDNQGDTYNWINTIDEGDYIEVLESNESDAVLYEVLQIDTSEDGPTINTVLNVKFLYETGSGDGKFNLQENYVIRVFKKDLGIDLVEADARYVQLPTTVIFQDTAPTTGNAPNSVLVNGELWYDTSSLELFTWNQNAWTATSKPPSQDIIVQSVVTDVDALQNQAVETTNRINSLISDLMIENNIYYGDNAPTGDITNTLRNGDIWIDSDDLTLKFYSGGTWVNPDRQVGGNYLETTGGEMTGSLDLKLGGATDSAIQILNKDTSTICTSIWCPGGAGTQTKYVGRSGTEHWFQNYSSSDTDPLTTAQFGYEHYSFEAHSNVSYGASDAHYFKGAVSIKQGNFENLKISQDGTVWGREGYIPTVDRQLTNKKYVDDRIAELEARITALGG